MARSEIAALRLVPEVALHRCSSLPNGRSSHWTVVHSSILDRSKMSLMRLSRSDARAVDGVRELHLTMSEVAVHVVRELLTELYENAVERRAQPVPIFAEFGASTAR